MSNNNKTIDSGSARPFREPETTGSALTPCVCGETAPPVNGRCPNPTCRKFRKGNTVALKTGIYSTAHLPNSEARCRAIRAHLLQSLGIRVPEPQLSAAIDDQAFVIVQRDLIASHLNLAGLFTDRGRRKAALDTYLALSQRAEKLTAQIRELVPPPPPDTSDDDAEALRWLTLDELTEVGAVVEQAVALGRSRRTAGEDSRDHITNRVEPIATAPVADAVHDPPSSAPLVAPDAGFRPRPDDHFTRALLEHGSYGLD